MQTRKDTSKANRVIATASGIPIYCSHTRIVERGRLVPNPRNPNKHGEEQVAMLGEIIKFAGWRAPIVVSRRSGYIIKGHGRLLAAEALKLDQVPVDDQDYENEAAEWQDMIADNRIPELAQMDKKLLKELSAEMREKFNIDPTLLGFDAKDFEKMLEVKEGGASKDELMEVPAELEGAKALKEDMYFESKLLYGIPEFKSDMLAEVPHGIKTWAGKEASDMNAPYYFYIISSGSIRELDLTRTILGFYTDDSAFEGAWTKPSEFTGKLLNRKLMAVVAPNFSLWDWMPKAVQIYNTYRARWLGRYFQEAGIKLIPDVNWSDKSSFEFCLTGIPKNPPAIAVQIQTSTGKGDARQRCVNGINFALDVLRPKQLMVCMWPTTGKEILARVDKGLLKKVDLIIVDSYLAARDEYKKQGQTTAGPKSKYKAKKERT